MNNPKVSVIIPVYNAEKYLACCIDSVLGQSFSDFELLLIDDGSQDKSHNICDAYARKDNRVCVFHKKNGGVSSARNVGLDHAKGEFIIFVDSDDYIDVDYIKRLTDYDEDLVLCGKKDVGSYIGEYNYPDLYVPYESIGKCLEQMIGKAPIGVPWGKIFNARIINEHRIRFDESMFVGEDGVFVDSYLIYCKSLRFISYSGYFYRTDYSRGRSYQMNEEQALHFLTKIFEAFDILRSKFHFNSVRFVTDNYYYAIAQFLGYQCNECKYSFNGFSKAKNFLKSNTLDELPSKCGKPIAVKLILGLLEHRKFSLLLVLWRFLMPLYKRFK